MNYTLIELSYLAGFLDGEGYFCISNICTRKIQNYQQKNLRIGATNTNKDVLDWIKFTFGGSVSYRGKPRSKKHKKSYVWFICNQKAEDLSRELLPYLKVKRLQAEVGLKFRETFHRKDSIVLERDGRPRKIINSYIPQHIIDVREIFRLQMNKLNRRGPNDNEAMS